MKKMIVFFAAFILACLFMLIPAGCGAKQYVITYESAGGTVAAPSAVVTYGKEFVLDVPSRGDATFLGWYQSADADSEQITDKYGKSLGKYMQTTDSTVYAKWSYWDTEGLIYDLTSDGEGYIVFAPEDFSGSLLKVPETYNGKPVVRVGTYGFSDLPSLTQVVLPDTILSIGSFAFERCTELVSVEGASALERVEERAFYRCSSLLSFDFPEKISFIGKEAFSGCSMLRSADFSAAEEDVVMEKNAFSGCTALSAVTLPERLEMIPEYLFSGCTALQEIELGGNIKQVSDGAFSSCSNLRKIHLGAAVTMLGDSVFSGCTYLREITVDESNAAFSADDSVLFDKSKSILYMYAPYKEGTYYRVPETVTRIREGAFADAEYCTELYVDVNVRQIDAGAFGNMQNLEKITLPFVGGSSYANTWFSYVFGGALSAMTTNVPYTLKYAVILTGTLVSERAFQFCNSLTGISLPDTLTAVGAYAFYGCSSLTELVLPAGVSSIGEDAMMACTRLQTVSFDGENEYYTSENGLLYDRDRTTLLLYPAGKTDTEFTVPETVTEIAGNAFYYASRLQSVILPQGLKKIGEGAFFNCRGLESATLPATLEVLGSQAFADCTGLKCVNLPEQLAEIGRQAFYGCTNLEKVVAEAAVPPSADDSVFLDTNDDFMIVFRSGEQLTAYSADAFWTKYSDRFVAEVGE